MSAIFIGYRRDDGGHARALYEKLLDWFDAGQVFLDHENLATGAKFSLELEQAAQGCRVFLAVIGPHWLSDKNRERLQDKDDITRGEIRGALQHDKPIIPVPAGGAGFPAEAAPPADIQGMCGNNAHHQPENQYLPAFHTLLATLEKNHGLKPRYRRRDGSPAPFLLIDLPLTRYFADPAGHLSEMRRTLEAQGAAAVIAAATVHGMGGIGKGRRCADDRKRIARESWRQHATDAPRSSAYLRDHRRSAPHGSRLPPRATDSPPGATGREPCGALLRASVGCVPMRSACCYTTVRAGRG